MLKIYTIKNKIQHKEILETPWDSYFEDKRITKYFDDTDIKIIKCVEETSLLNNETIYGKFSDMPIGIGKITSDIKNGISNKDKGTDLLIQFDTMKDEKKNGQGYIVMTVFNVSQSTIVERLNILLNGHELVNDKVIPCGNFSSFKVLSYANMFIGQSYPYIAEVNCYGEFDYNNQITINDSGETVFTLEVNDEQYEMTVDLYKILRLK